MRLFEHGRWGQKKSPAFGCSISFSIWSIYHNTCWNDWITPVCLFYRVWCCLELFCYGHILGSMSPRKQLKLNFHCVVGRDGSLIHCDIYGWKIREGMKVKWDDKRVALGDCGFLTRQGETWAKTSLPCDS